MDRHQRQVLRVAQAIVDQYVERQRHGDYVDLPDYGWQSCLALLRKAERARQHGWDLAAAKLRFDLSFALDNLRFTMGTVVKQLRQVPEQPSFASILDIYRDILALHAEFDDVSWDLHAKTLSVTTTDIVLEGIYLGPFEIRLDFSQLIGSNAYEVIAVDPHPAASDESVTHPHVQDNEPCEGEAGLPIEQALKDGRIADFFLIVLNLLNTYNSGSPHVALKNWEGAPCRDCGANVSEDERFSCEHCGDVLCDGCFVSYPSQT